MTLLEARSTTFDVARAGRLASAVVACVLLAGGLTACGSSPDDVTCGEYLDKSTSDRADFVKDAINDQASDAEKKQIEAAGDDAYGLVAEAIASTCEGEDKDKKLGDIAGDIGG